MTRRELFPHLRLVSSTPSNNHISDIEEIASAKWSGARQLAFPYFDAFAFLLADVRRLDAYAFPELLKSSRPNWIFDVRVTPRMDLLAGTRQNAFSLISSINAEYVDLFGKLGLQSYLSAGANPGLWSREIGSVVLESRRPTGPFMVLMDDERLLEASRKLLPESLNAIFRKQVSVAVLH